MDPLKRLGAGENGTDFDYTHLKNHPFFNDIDFDSINDI